MEQEDDTGILKELIIGIRRQLNERLISPLMPAFTISWIIVNYRLIVTIFSNGSLESRLSFIDTKLYPTSHFAFIHGFLLPLVCALFYIFAYPYPAKWVYQYSLKRQRELRETRQNAENASVLTLEESKKLRAYYYDRETTLQKRIEARQEETEQLRAKIEVLEKTQLLNIEPKAPDREPSQVLTDNDLNEIQGKILEALGFAENEQIHPQRESDLRDIINIDVTDLRIALEDLQIAKFITRSFNSSLGEYVFKLSHEGRLVLKKQLSKSEQEHLK